MGEMAAAPVFRDEDFQMLTKEELSQVLDAKLAPIGDQLSSLKTDVAFLKGRAAMFGWVSTVSAAVVALVAISAYAWPRPSPEHPGHANVPAQAQHVSER
jgi:hypothetical protein